ncbi:6-O-methylguanine DNA methyltransferase DNA binding domain [Halarchaeum acidiphilum MH1-52-1]|uniref:6-O-methylguanine DNA methyltransferase DNA binding domain n=1 Tax=Halarchaeum acidiphilum MH1-52-1 TaxID=1261545 RepID=U2YEV9_9EURY|nr:MGMT family protein [Halarchaeum acidiphilum]GAD52411.1 6-O-methylguanine DNA methyltransferase DNA binding domain [Halarchaeum acidiphilum MH1-52-1]
MDAGLYALRSSYLDRYVQLGVAGDRVISVSFPKDPDEDAEDDHPLFDRLNAYLEGVEDDFADVAVGLTMPTNQRAVLETVREIGYGEQVTVDALTRMTPGLDADEEADCQLARTALAENPVPLVIPDHRVRDAPSGAPPDVEQKVRSLEGL